MSTHTFMIGFTITSAGVIVLLLLSRRWPITERIALVIALLFMTYVGVDSLVWSVDDIAKGRLVDVTRYGSSVASTRAQTPLLFWMNAVGRLVGWAVWICLCLKSLKNAVKGATDPRF